MKVSSCLKKLACGEVRRGLAAAALFGAFAGFAGTPVWVGGSGAWSDAANWRDGQMPRPGDTVYVSNTVGNVTIDIDVAEVSLASIRFEGASPAALTGNGLTLTGGMTTKTVPNLTNILDFPACVAGFLSYKVDVDCGVPLTFAPAGGDCGICISAVTVDFRGKVACAGTGNFKVHSGSEGNLLGTLNFHGEVSAPNATFRPQQHPTGIAHFYAPVAFKDIGNYGWSGQKLHFHAGGNSWGKLTLDYNNNTIAYADGVYPANMVVALGNTDVAHEDCGIFNLGNHDAVIDRIDGDLLNNEKLIYVDNTKVVRCGMIRSTSGIDGGGTALPAVLTMNATADGLSSFAVYDQVSLVWNPVDDHTLTMTGRVHTTTGSIDVRRGGFRMAGACSFANVNAIRLGDGAWFDEASTLGGGVLAGVKEIELGAGALIAFPEGTAQDCASAVVNLAAGAKVALPAGASLKVAAVNVNGAFLPNGSYQGEDWIDGEGRVEVDSGNIAFWKNPEGGDWSDGDNWTSGAAPTDENGLSACLTMRTESSYTVRLDRPLAKFGGNLKVGNAGGGQVTLLLAADVTATQANITVSRGGLVDVPTGKTFTFVGTPHRGDVQVHYPASEWRTIAVENGGEWRVSGGATVITNFCGNFIVQGTGEDAVGKLTMSSGTFLYMNDGSAFPLTINPNGRVDFTGGLFKLPHQGYNHSTDIANQGGVMRLKGVALNTEGKFEKPNGGSLTFTTGETFFEEGSSLDVVNGNKIIHPNAAGETASVTYRNGATATQSHDYVPWVIYGGLGKAVFNWDGADSGNTMCFKVGFNKGYGELNVNSGVLRGHPYGFLIGGYSNVNTIGDDDESVGQVTVAEGATLDVRGSLDSGWSATSGFSALVVGHGISSLDKRFAYSARLDLHGTLVNQTGNSVIGLGKAEGTYVQHGGSSTFQTTVLYSLTGQTIVGMAGGRGRVIVSNGVFKVQNGNLYVGGCLTNELQVFDNKTHLRVPWVGQAEYPYELRDADGKVSVAGGAVTVNNATVLGVDGTGSLEMLGSTGSFTTKDLVLSNSTESVLRFVPDANGVSPIKVTNRLAICEGAKIAVDVTGLSERQRQSFKVLDTAGATVDGAFALENVTVTGADPTRRIVLRQNESGVTVTVAKGFMLLIK